MMTDYGQLDRHMAEFLELWPPLRKYRKPVADDLGNMARPAIRMPCAVCGFDQTFVNVGCENNYGQRTVRYQLIESPWNALIARYICAGCEKYGRLFFLETGGDGEHRVIRKLGQKPDWQAAISPDVASALGNQAFLFRRGADCEASGYGVGAFAYYRRVVELVIEGLLERVASLLDGEVRDQYLSALERTRSIPAAEDKIALVKDLLPATLRPQGLNPLDLLYGALSEGLHAQTDEQCLDIAATISQSLVFLIQELRRSEKAQHTFTESMRKLLGRRSQGKGVGGSLEGV